MPILPGTGLEVGTAVQYVSLKRKSTAMARWVDFTHQYVRQLIKICAIPFLEEDKR